MSSFKIIFFTCFAVMITSCASSQDSSQKKEDDIYVFDEVSPEKNVESFPSEDDFPEPSAGSHISYAVQIGAFTTKDKAEEFKSSSSKILNRELSMFYNEKVNLFVVQLAKVFDKKEDAESVRDELWKMKNFKDAWITQKEN